MQPDTHCFVVEEGLRRRSQSSNHCRARVRVSVPLLMSTLRHVRPVGLVYPLLPWLLFGNALVSGKPADVFFVLRVAQKDTDLPPESHGGRVSCVPSAPS